MKSLKWIKFFLTLNLALLAAPAFAQQAQRIDPPACDSEIFGKLLYVVDCAKEKCPYEKEQQGLYEMICVPEFVGENLRRRGFDELLDKVGGPEALPAAKNTSTLSPCDCLAKLEEKFACGIETCEAKMDPAPMTPPATTGKVETSPASEEDVSGGCSLSSAKTPQSLALFGWMVMFLGALFLARRFPGKLKLGSALALGILLVSLTGCGAGSGENSEAENASNSTATSPTSTPTTSPSGRWLTAYYPSYQQFTMPPSEINYSAMTHLIHWPVLPEPDGSLDTLSIDFTEAHSKDVVTRAHAAGIKVLLGIGGDADSGATKGFQGATSPANRATFIKNIVNLMQTRGYDGVDINWEEIGAADDAQFIALIQELRVALDANNPRPLLTMPPTTGADARPELVAKVAAQFDQINLQTYVMSGPYPGWVTWHNSPLSNLGFEFPSAPGERLPSIEDEITRWENAGIPLNRMGLGIQFAGFVWSGGSGTDTGGATKPRQSWAIAPALTVVDYTVVTKLIAEGYQKEFDNVAHVPYLTRDSANNADDRFVSYENEQSIQEKADFLKAKGLGGMFIFELTGDYFPGTADLHPLLSAAKQSVLN